MTTNDRAGELSPTAKVFLFDADDSSLSDYYGLQIDKAFYRSVLTADPDRRERFMVGSGDLLVHSLSYRTTRVEVSEDRFGGGTTRSNDSKLRFALIWDLCDSASEGWHSFEPNRLALTIARHNIAAICASNLSEVISNQICELLSETSFFVGAFEIDAGNPLQRHLLFDLLIFDEIYSAGSLLFVPDITVPEDDLYDLAEGGFWWSNLPFDLVGWFDEALHGEVPELPSAPLSDRGRKSKSLLQNRAAPHHIEHVAEALEAAIRAEGQPQAWDLPQLPRSNEAVIPTEKLVQYALNPKHDTGKHKARLFEELLDLRAEDWRFLEYQIRRLLPVSPVIQRARLGEHGLQYHVDIPVQGRNNRVEIVRTAWIIRTPEPPQLVTMFFAPPATTKENLPRPITPPLISDPTAGPDSWGKLMEAARAEALKAANLAAPDPMVIEGDVVPEGEFGWAWVHLADARRRLNKWLLETSLASRSYPTGVRIYAPYHFVQRSVAYADAFADVLRLNGFDCEVQSRLD